MKNQSYLLFCLLFLFNASNIYAAETVIFTERTEISEIIKEISEASDDDVFKFFPNTYELNIILNTDKKITLEGVDTKNTILSSNDSDKPIIEFDQSSKVTIKGFTFLDSNKAIVINDNRDNLEITNNIFQMGKENIAIEMGSSAFVETSVEITNNTFYDNGINIDSRRSSVLVSNNIFQEYDVLFDDAAPGIIKNNCIESDLEIAKESDGNKLLVGDNFVDIEADEDDEDKKYDFHLIEDSSCIDVGRNDDEVTETDAGAYGGEAYDQAPESMTDTLRSNPSKPDLGQNMTLTWSQNKDHKVVGYTVYYSREAISSLSPESLDDASKRKAKFPNAILTEGLSANLSLPGPNVVVAVPVAPTLSKDNVVPGNNRITLSWDAVANATSYSVTYAAGNENPQTEDAKDATSYVIDGLINNKVYDVSVTAHNQLSYYFQVVSRVEKDEDQEEEDLVESYFHKDDIKLDIGTAVSSNPSNSISVQPEKIVAYPNLPNEGCFIATAAFGYYSSSQVQVLRDFRDQHLLTNNPGQVFVKLYYHYGPYAASIINEYSLLKPIVRVLLYPLILAVETLNKTVLGFFLLLGVYLLLSLAIIRVIIIQIYKRVSYT